MLKMRFGLALALALTTALVLGTSLGSAARSRAQANVTIHLAGPATAAAGDNLTYTLTVRNNGPRQARGVVVRDRLPAGVTLNSATPSKGSCVGSAVVTCSLGRLNRFAVARVVIVVNAPNAGRLVNVATVRANQRDFAMWNNNASLTTVVGAGADLGVTLKATPRPATMGQPLTYTLTIRNHSSVDATNVVVTERTPARSTLVSANASQGSCTGAAPTICSLGTLAAGATAQITVVVQPTAVGYITNHATVKSAALDPFRVNNSRSLQVRVRPAA
jgi:large repetitive protein